MRRPLATWTTAAAASVTLGAVLLPTGGPVGAERPGPVIESVALDNEKALEGFRQALHELEQGERDRVRVLHWGDSNVAAGVWADTTRDAFQKRFGDGGPGYMVPRFGTHDVGHLIRATDAWKARRRGFNGDYGPRDGRWGLAGVAASGRGADARVDVDVPNLDQGGVFEVHALQQPHGGKLEVRIDEGEPDTVDTSGEEYGLMRSRWELEPGAHEIDVRVASWHPVRLLGVVLERARSGIVWDVLGINGHRASAILEWDRSLLRAQLRHRDPDLVVLSYGGNEALDPNIPPERFGMQLEKTIRRVRHLVPDTSLLVVGPVAMCPSRPPVSKVNPKIEKVVRVQEKVATRLDAAFWNSSGVMGGPDELCGWRARDPQLVSGDNLHLSRKGYEIVGKKFAEALLEEL